MEGLSSTIDELDNEINKVGEIIDEIKATNEYIYELYSEDEDYVRAVERIRKLKAEHIEILNSIKEKLFCPICSSEFLGSDYLRVVFKDYKTRWLANMVTHYRHNHITSWNKCWGKNGSRYRSNWFGDYDAEKMKINERAKRQIIRKAKQYLNTNGINVSHFLELENTEERTITLATKVLV